MGRPPPCNCFCDQPSVSSVSSVSGDSFSTSLSISGFPGVAGCAGCREVPLRYGFTLSSITPGVGGSYPLAPPGCPCSPAWVALWSQLNRTWTLTKLLGYACSWGEDFYFLSGGIPVVHLGPVRARLDLYTVTNNRYWVLGITIPIAAGCFLTLTWMFTGTADDNCFTPQTLTLSPILYTGCVADADADVLVSPV